MKLYIAGPMTGYPEYNYPAFNRAEEILIAHGYDVLNPARRGVVDGWGWVDYMRPALRDISEADGLAVLDGWHASRGATLEVDIAQRLDLRVARVEAWCDADFSGVPRSTARVRTCRECGCTDNRACDPACYWVDLDLCSRCGA